MESSVLDTSTPFDEQKVRYLEELIKNMLVGDEKQRKISNDILSELRAREESWRIVGTILQCSNDYDTKFFALTILGECIEKRWKILPDEQKAGIKQYITDMAVSVGSDPNASCVNYFITKVNKVLVEIVKQEWPHNWPTFLPDLCGAARTSQIICENAIRILNLLSEDVFDFGRDQLTSKKVGILMENLTEQFQHVYDLCIFVIQNHIQEENRINPSLMHATLKCVSHFLKWIPHGYIFETGIIDVLLNHFWKQLNYQMDCIRCLIEVASIKHLENEESRQKFGLSFWAPLVEKLGDIYMKCINVDRKPFANQRSYWEMYFCNLAILLTTFLRNHRVSVCENYPEKSFNGTVVVLDYLVEMTQSLSHEETFKILVDYWNFLAQELLADAQKTFESSRSNGKKDFHTESLQNELKICSARLASFEPSLYHLREALILKMARPKEVCIHYDEETGTVDRDYQADTDEIALYNSMRDTLVYLTHLQEAHTQEVMMRLLETLIEDAKNPIQETFWNPMLFSRYCWAIGSISGAMSYNREKTFLILVIKELLWLCENKRGKEKKAIVASMIMYVFGQYPRFLKSYVRFLETVLVKLFEFMLETFKGVQDMACETFLKIAQKCVDAIASTPPGDPGKKPLIELVLEKCPYIYPKLQTTKQQLMLIEGVGHIIAGVQGLDLKQSYIESLISRFADEWATAYLELSTSMNPEVAKKITEILLVYERIASTNGTSFSLQLTAIYPKLLHLHSLISEAILKEVPSQGEGVMHHVKIKKLRGVRVAGLLLIKSFVNSSLKDSSDKDFDPENESIKKEVAQFIIPPLLTTVLEDYKQGLPVTKDHEVLSLCSVLIRKLQPHLTNELTNIFNCVFGCTLDMIKIDFNSYIEHRIAFYDLLQSITEKCFEAIFLLRENDRSLFIQSLIWAFKHEHITVAEQGLKILYAFLSRLTQSSPGYIVPFCNQYYGSLLIETLDVLTDTLHKSGFKYQTVILMHLFQIVDLGYIQFSKDDVVKLMTEVLLRNFSNLNRTQIEAFGLRAFIVCGDPKEFSKHIRDFLIQLKEFSGSEELFEDERKQALEETLNMERYKCAAPGMQVPGCGTDYVPAKDANLDELE